MFIETTPRSWDDAKRLGGLLSCWVFRGHTCATWPLSTALERAADRFGCSSNLRWIRERVLVHDFRRKAHHYIQSPPSPDEHLEWLALVQHHGGPTRLLDFTTSFYVASFFAVETADEDACVWAVNELHLSLMLAQNCGIGPIESGGVIEQQEATVRFAEQFLRDRSQRMDYVVSVQPVRQNQRLAIQKGLFLFPCDVEKTFESNLCATLGFSFTELCSRNATQMDTSGIDREMALRAKVIKINFPRSWHAKAYLDLYSMNLDAASLFPGLTGFARSLQYHLRCMEGIWGYESP